MKIVLSITGASGAIYGVRALQVLHDLNVETHLVISEAAKLTLQYETEWSVEALRDIASELYDNNQIGAAIASGSFQTDAMIIIPCSMKTLACVANGISDTLTARAADVMLKERRKLILCPRETPLNAIHIKNMLTLCELGAYIIPPCPAFYNKPKSIDDIIDHHIMKITDALGLEHPSPRRWDGNLGGQE